MSSTPLYLKSTKSGRVYPYSPGLAARQDMVPFEMPAEAGKQIPPPPTPTEASVDPRKVESTDGVRDALPSQSQGHTVAVLTLPVEEPANTKSLDEIVARSDGVEAMSGAPSPGARRGRKPNAVGPTVSALADQVGLK